MVLIAATLFSLVARRAELRAEQDTLSETVSSGVVDLVDTTLGSARAAVEVAPADADPEMLAASFGGAQACASGAVPECTGADLFGLAAGSAPTPSTVGGSVVFTDERTGSVMVMAENGGTVVLQLPADTLIAGSRLSELAEVAVSVADDNDSATTISEPVEADGQLVTEGTVGEPLDAGIVRVHVAVDAELGLLADAPTRYGTWLALGTVLLALAAWTLFAERRSLERRATTDELTGLVNRREFERQADEALLVASRLGTGLCVMLVDLNGFKEINDTFGHQSGDVALRGCADRLVAAVRDTDVVGRWGGDEFVILLPGLAERTAVRSRAERIAEALSELPVVGDIRVSGSIGAAMYPRHGADFEDLMRAADLAMYGAKTTGVPFRIADLLPDEVGPHDGEPLVHHHTTEPDHDDATPRLGG